MRVLVLHSLPPQTPTPGRLEAEFDLQGAAQAVAEALPGATIHPTTGTPGDILHALNTHRPTVVFNACEAPLGRPDLEPHVAALLEWAGIPFTGCGSETLALCRRKDRTNAVLAAHAVPIPPAHGYPCIVKPRDQDGSAGIDSVSVCDDEPAMQAARARLAARVPGPALVQRFLPGREFAVALWGRTEPLHTSLAEAGFDDNQRLNTYLSKWDTEGPEYQSTWLDYRPQLPPGLHDTIIATATAAWRAVDARSYLRVDLRLDHAGTPCVLDVNPNPSIEPGTGMHRAVQEAGCTWPKFVRQLIDWARP